MAIAEVTMYRVICDRCGASAQDGDFYAWATKDSAIDEATGSDWLVNDDGHWCGDCTTWDEDADEEVPKPPLERGRGSPPATG